MTSFLKEQRDYFIEHPPYSPDRAPLTFFSSLVSRKILLVKNIPPAKSLVLPHLTFLEVYQNRKICKDWIKRLKLCVSVKEEYFEGLVKNTIIGCVTFDPDHVSQK